MYTNVIHHQKSKFNCSTIVAHLKIKINILADIGIINQDKQYQMQYKCSTIKISSLAFAPGINMQCSTYVIQ